MRLGYADPPYPDQAERHYGDHPDYAGEVDHGELLIRLDRDYDGLALHTSSVALPDIFLNIRDLGIRGYRTLAWVKTFAAFKANVSVAYAWEPVLVKAARKPTVSDRMVYRDWIAEPITMHRGLAGAKPNKVCRWVFECMGAHPDDILDDLYPGTGAVGHAWDAWRGVLTNPRATQEALALEAQVTS